MKNLLLGAALVAVCFACKTDKNTAITDPSTPNTPKAECQMKEGCCPEKAADCSDAAKAECMKKCPATAPQN